MGLYKFQRPARRRLRYVDTGGTVRDTDSSCLVRRVGVGDHDQPHRAQRRLPALHARAVSALPLRHCPRSSYGRAHVWCVRNAQAPGQSEPYISKVRNRTLHISHISKVRNRTLRISKVRNRTFRISQPGHYAARHSRRAAAQGRVLESNGL